KDWYSVAGCESAFLAFDPDQPDEIYGGCYQGIIERWIKAANESKIINEYPEQGLSKEPKDAKYRFNWNAPIISDPFDRSVIYHAGNRVFKTTDGGISWEVISPDLTRDEVEKQGPGGGPYTNEAAGGENYNTLSALVASPHEKGVLYAGSDDGRVHITQNGGSSWQEITPNGIGEYIINSIEVSPHDPATAYIAVMGYKSMDLQPYIFKTNNYGKSWEKIVNGIEGEHTFVRVVREDRKVKGLLYAGTETGLFISKDDGKSWKPFQLNLPVVPINDLAIQDNDLIAATAGRSFWILDDLGAIQHRTPSEEKLALIPPKDTYFFVGGKAPAGNGLGENPASGVTIDYYIPKVTDSLDVKLEVLYEGEVIRTISNTPPKDQKSWTGGPPKPSTLKAQEGYNRYTWDFRRETLPAVDNVFVFGDYRGAQVIPGTYTLRLTADEEVAETKVTILPNSNLDTTAAQFAEKHEMTLELEELITEIHTSINTMRSVQDQLKHYKKLLKDREEAGALLEKGDSLQKRITSWEENLIQTKQKTFQDVINFNNKLNSEVLYLKDFIDSSLPQPTEGSKERLRDLKADWQIYAQERDKIVADEMAEYNRMYEQLNLPALLMIEK
ncbi:MAG: glycosyl hydrolase, partial [Flavobacteriaceae bacterium]|nr:glycosyl hydrolase [Flavobacteriaceae bacterium]